MTAFAVGCFLCQIAAPARGQWGQVIPSDLSSAIRVDEVDSSARALLERVKANVAAKQWDEAIETLREVMQQQGDKLIRFGDSRYIPVREYCQMQLAGLPAPARALYRSRVDPLAKRWYDDGIAHRDAALLRRVVDQLFLSSWTDKALLALGDIALEEADFAEARWCWERISPELRTPDGRPLWLSLRVAKEAGATAARPAAAPAAATPSPPQWLAYPDTQLNLVDVRARLVLASILEGSLARARIELDDFNRRYPKARGRIGGREGPYSDLLAGMFATAERRPAPAPPTDWPTFAGSFDRTAGAAPDPGLRTAWIDDLPLPDDKPFRTDTSIGRDTFGLPEHRPAEDQLGLLCFHPIVVGELVLLDTLDKIYAFDLATGKPAWPLPPGDKNHEPGEIYSGLTGRENLAARNESGNQFHTLGAPRFSMTAAGHRLYARLGSPITSRLVGSGLLTGNNYLVCLDLAAEGRLVWRVPQTPVEDDRWTFEGPPVCDGDNVYVAMRYYDQAQPQEHVACFDAATGMMRWRRLVCAAESPARGQADEITNNLLTLDHQTLYLNTNLGVIAAISTGEGRIRWLSTYPRAKRHSGIADPPANFYRDLNPCVYDRGSVLAAPTDCEAILSLDSSTGELLWASTLPRDVVHLLGVGGGNLLASGQRLWWINVDGGKVVYRWPDQATDHGYGRGALVGDDVYFPTRTAIHVFRQALSRTVASDATRVRDPIQLDTRDPPLSGGNLVAAGGYLLIATSDKLIALGPHGGPPPNRGELTQAAARSAAQPSAPQPRAAEQ